ncbi:OmpA family protein [Reichenbachiella ulvae]|uniref:OmpA family protein n=1 Tax=Reichenbachiella ulvae TaxID=2980104 RepID=A0ABT3CXB0_9BACT|nr:OmpA family protein [Reichenbachiella ulvae]MCV9388340.1 OmpA family protein [Reichenbachiella ulvae]
MSLKSTLTIVSLLIAITSFAQSGDKLIRVTGTVTDPESNQPISAKVFYEKLPYYDDMGVANTDPGNGVYELNMIENQKYIISVKADGYKPISQEIEILDKGLGLIEKNFKMEPDAMHEKITLDNLIFARGKAIITEESHEELDEFAKWLEQRPNAVVQLEGHTDFQGNADANMKLSEDRVEAVKEYLVGKGIKKSRIKTKAFGGTQPLTRERTPEARTKNRRVEVRIIQQ